MFRSADNNTSGHFTSTNIKSLLQWHCGTTHCGCGELSHGCVTVNRTAQIYCEYATRLLHSESTAIILHHCLCGLPDSTFLILQLTPAHCLRIYATPTLSQGGRVGLLTAHNSTSIPHYDLSAVTEWPAEPIESSSANPAPKV